MRIITWMLRKYGTIFKIGSIVNKRISTYDDNKWDEKVGLLNEMKSDVVAKIMKGDFSIGLFLGLLLRNPKIVGKSLFKLIKKYLKGPQ